MQRLLARNPRRRRRTQDPSCAPGGSLKAACWGGAGDLSSRFTPKPRRRYSSTSCASASSRISFVRISGIAHCARLTSGRGISTRAKTQLFRSTEREEGRARSGNFSFNTRAQLRHLFGQDGAGKSATGSATESREKAKGNDPETCHGVPDGI